MAEQLKEKPRREWPTWLKFGWLPGALLVLGAVLFWNFVLAGGPSMSAYCHDINQAQASGQYNGSTATDFAKDAALYNRLSDEVPDVTTSIHLGTMANDVVKVGTGNASSLDQDAFTAATNQVGTYTKNHCE